MQPIQLRRARPDDAPAFARFMADETVFGGLLQLPYPDEAAWRQRLAPNTDPLYPGLHLVALLDDELVGSAGLHVAMPVLRRRHAMVLGIGVAVPAHGQGVGSALLAALLDYADRWAGVLRVELTVWADNARAIRLYERFGFAHEGRHRAWGLRDGRYEDALCMARLHPDASGLMAGVAAGASATPAAPPRAP